MSRQLKEEKELRRWKHIISNHPMADKNAAEMFLEDVRNLVRAVREEDAKTGTSKYSGEASIAFWNCVNSFRSDDPLKDKLHSRLYRLGCDLQNIESKVLNEIAAALRDRR